MRPDRHLNTDLPPLLKWRSESIHHRSRRNLLIGIAVGFAVFLLWASLTHIDGITRSTGTVVPFSQNQIVQHLEGGIVSEILVREGDKVSRDQVLLRIRDQQSQTTLQQNQTQLAAKRATLARLEAELGDSVDVTFPADLADNPLIANERELFVQRRRDHMEQTNILDDKIRQNEIALAGLQARKGNLLRERDIAQQRADSVQRLQGVGAASRNDLLQSMAVLQQLDTKIGDVMHDIPQTEAALSEAVRQRNAALLKFKSDASEEKVKILVDITQLNQAVAGLRDRATRTDIRSPTDGIVNKRYVATVGGVISPGAPILEIVPSSDTIAIEAQLSPQDRAEIWPGTRAIVKITAYDYSLYGGLEAEVVDISPDLIREKDNPPYFRVRLNAANKLGANYRIIPGMMANVDMLTKRYTVLQYLMTPLTNVQDMAFRR